MATSIAKTEPRKPRTFFRHGALESIREEMQDLLSRTLGEEGDVWAVNRITPSLDLVESNAALEVRLDLPRRTAFGQVQ